MLFCSLQPLFSRYPLNAYGVTLALLTTPASFSQTSPINPTPSNLERNLVELPINQASNQQVLLAGAHDHDGKWVWGDGTIERNYDWERGYY
jgi:hypothetical protein